MPQKAPFRSCAPDDFPLKETTQIVKKWNESAVRYNTIVQPSPSGSWAGVWKWHQYSFMASPEEAGLLAEADPAASREGSLHGLASAATLTAQKTTAGVQNP